MSEVSHDEIYSSGMYGLPHMGEVVADYRLKRGWKSQKIFAVVCGVDTQTVVYWENQRYLADMDRRIFLCKLLKIPPVLLGLTWRSVIDEEKAQSYIASLANMTELLTDNSYGLYEDILTLANTSTDKYAPATAYRFYKHRQELEALIEQAPETEKESWQDLLSRYYQHSTFIAQHHGNDGVALHDANRAVELAVPLDNQELLGASLYRRARIHLIQNRQNVAKQDIQEALNSAEHARGPLKGSSYLLAAEINSLYAEGDEKLKTQCRKWQDLAANLIYKKKIEDDETFLTFNLYAVHHERAKTLTRFALFHTTDSNLVECLSSTRSSANKKLLKDAESALMSAKSHLMESSHTRQMYLAITEARIYLVAGEFETSASTAKSALQYARMAHSKQGEGEIRKIYAMLSSLAPENPYVCNLGVELGVYN